MAAQRKTKMVQLVIQIGRRSWLHRNVYSIVQYCGFLFFLLRSAHTLFPGENSFYLNLVLGLVLNLGLDARWFGLGFEVGFGLRAFCKHNRTIIYGYC